MLPLLYIRYFIKLIADWNFGNNLVVDILARVIVFPLYVIGMSTVGLFLYVVIGFVTSIVSPIKHSAIAIYDPYEQFQTIPTRILSYTITDSLMFTDWLFTEVFTDINLFTDLSDTINSVIGPNK